MKDEHFSTDEIAHVVQLHSLAMFCLGPLNGFLSDRYGQHLFIGLGFLEYFVGCFVMIGRHTYGDYIGGMFAVGLAWNTVFVSSTSLLAQV